MTKNEELKIWEDNLEILNDQLRAAYRFKNASAALDIRVRISTTLDMIERLKKEGQSDPNGSVSSAIPSHIKVAKKPPMDFNGINLAWK